MEDEGVWRMQEYGGCGSMENAGLGRMREMEDEGYGGFRSVEDEGV
ncbi:hypothetical protein [Penaeicola halotolerans]|nr:hypothetical protein [Penaeicola halotolerans]